MSNTTDGRISETIRNKLASRGLSPCRLAVQTSNGRVTISGTVEHTHQVNAAASIARAMSGVRGVVNQVTVKPRTAR